jgi:phage minor structural protein
MAVQKALFTTQNDFTTPLGIGPLLGDPFLRFDGSGIPSGWEVVGTAPTSAEIVAGPYQKATKFNNNKVIRKKDVVFPASNRRMLCAWIKPTATDLTTQWSIFATTRGSAYASVNYGLHLALNYDSTKGYTMFHYRASGVNSSGVSSDTNGFTDGSGVSRSLLKVNADQWYHVALIYDYDPVTAKPTVGVHAVEVYVDGVLVMYDNFVSNITASFTRTLSVGDMPNTSTLSGTNNFEGQIAEVIWENGSRVWTAQQLNDYITAIKDGNWIDSWTSPGSMQLGNSLWTGFTQTMQVWTSPVVDLGLNGFGDYGRVQFTYIQPPGTAINLWTRTSNDGTTWDAWIKVASDGSIASADKRFIQVKVDFSTTLGTVTPVIQEMQILDYPAKLRLTLTSQPLVLYNDKATGLERIGELANAYDIFITEEIINESGGEETIEWKMAIDDPKRKELGTEPVETIARIGDKQFIIKNPVDSRDESGKKITQFTGEALWYELRDFKVITIDKTEIDPTTMIQAILDGSIVPTGWTIGKIDASLKTLKRTITGDWKTVLELLLEVCNLFGAELKFDTIDRTISLVEKIGEDNGVRFYYNKNLKTIERSVDSYDLITRLYLYGANDMTVKTVHPDGLDYVENLDWVNALNLRNKIRVDRFKDERYTIPQNLYDDGKKMVDELSKPTISYSMKISDLSILSGHEHESIGIGDTIYAIDTELMNLLIDARIVRRKYNVRQPKDSEVELNQPKKTLADANQRNIDDNLELLTQSDPLDTSDVQQMTVFNHLLNSRAEDGNTYWEVTGTGITNEVGGFSGDASWKIDSGYGKTNSLKQSLFGVSHRSAYTVSAYVYNEGTITRGSSQDAFVGIKVTIHYTEPDDKGNTFEEHLLAIPDITQTTTGGA